MDHVIAYASQTLSKSEKNYDAHKLEFLALKWSVTEDSMSIFMVENLRFTQITIH